MRESCTSARILTTNSLIRCHVFIIYPVCAACAIDRMARLTARCPYSGAQTLPLPSHSRNTGSLAIDDIKLSDSGSCLRPNNCNTFTDGNLVCFMSPPLDCIRPHHRHPTGPSLISSSQMIAVLLFLQREDSASGVSLYFNCPGGEVSSSAIVMYSCTLIELAHDALLARAGSGGRCLVSCSCSTTRALYERCRWRRASPGGGVHSAAQTVAAVDPVVVEQVRAGLALYDTMKSMGFPVTTLNLGIAASIRSVLSCLA